MIYTNEVTKIYLFMSKDLGLKGNEIIIYSVIYNAGTAGYTGTQEQLGKFCGISNKQAGLIIKELEKKGLIKSFKNPNGQNKPKKYIATKLKLTHTHAILQPETK